MKNKTEATKFLEEQLDKIHFVDAYFFSNHGINIHFTLNINQLDLSKNHPDELYFYDKEGKYLMDYNKKRSECWLSYHKIWTKLKEDFVLNVQEIKEVTQSKLEEQFKCKVSTVLPSGMYNNSELEKKLNARLI